VLDVNLRPTGAFAPDLSVEADVASFVDTVLLRLSGRPPWADSPFRIRDDVRHDALTDDRTRDAAALVDAVERAWPFDNAIVCDMAVAGYWVGGYSATQHPRRLLYPVGWGTLGYGLPAALGVAAAGVPTLAVVGDGGVAMAIGELATLRQHDLPVTLLVVDDGGYGMLRFDQRRAGHAERGVSLVSPEWEALAAAYRLPLHIAPDADSLRDALAASAVTGGPRLVVMPATLFPPRSTSPRWADPDR
jgi:acetolactate synthase-1/2/3 large subunit